MDYSALYLILLVISGILAGFINTIAGGGSIFTLPALMLMGMPADVANGTNRVGVVIQSLAGVREFHQQDKLDKSALFPILAPTVLGALLGSIAASVVPVAILKPILLGTIMAMALLIVIRPSTLPAEDEINLTVFEKPSSLVWLFMAGVYGGFVQAGVGFILLTALAGSLRYDLVRANALKVLCALVFSCVALGVFIIQGQVEWVPGLIMGLSTIVGVRFSVKFAIKAKQSTLKRILLVMALLVCVAALLS